MSYHLVTGEVTVCERYNYTVITRFKVLEIRDLARRRRKKIWTLLTRLGDITLRYCPPRRPRRKIVMLKVISTSPALSQTSPPQAENFGILTSEVMISLRKIAFPDSKIAKFSACGELSQKIFASGEIPHKKAPPLCSNLTAKGGGFLIWGGFLK